MHLISNKDKGIFFHMPKTGGSSITVLLKNNGWIFTEPIALPDRMLNDYYFFTFVRNPYDRFVSGWKRTMVKCARGGNGKMIDYNFTMTQFRNDFKLDKYRGVINKGVQEHFYLSQSKILGRLHKHINHFYRYEDFDSEVNVLMNKFKCIVNRIPNENKSQIINYREWITPEIAKYIESKYSDDFKLFNYEIENF